MKIRLYVRGERDRWNKYVMRSSDASCYHLIGWKDVIERSFGHKTYYLMATEDHEKDTIYDVEGGKWNDLAKRSDGIVGILPLVHLRSIFFGNFIVSIPYFNYGGICAENEEIAKELMREGANIAVEKHVEHIELRHIRNMINGLPVKKEKVSVRLEIPKNSEELWKSFSAKLRSQIRRPTKEGMYSKFGRIEELGSFYDVFSTNMRDLGTPVYSKQFFKNILEEFPETTWICTVYTKEDVPVASGFLVGFKETLEIPWASSLRSYKQHSPNMLLYWSALKFACVSGYKVFDFGRSSQGGGTYKFKEQWGAKPVQLYWHYWVKNGGPLPELNPDNPKYQLAIKIWQKLPVSLTRIIGPLVVKNLP